MGGCNIFFGWKMVWGEMKWRGEESLFEIFLDTFPPFLGKETICPPHPPSSFFFSFSFFPFGFAFWKGVLFSLQSALWQRQLYNTYEKAREKANCLVRT